ncbi:hypothetical protein D3C86_1126560 [compost metagenome]
MSVIRHSCAVAIATFMLAGCALSGNQPVDPTKGPRITSLQVSSSRVTPGGIIGLEVTAQSPDDSKLTYLWSSTQGMISDPRSPRPHWIAPNSAFGQDTYITLSVRVIDDKQREDSRQETVTVAN